MSGKGNCYANQATFGRIFFANRLPAVVISFFKSLKAEMIWRRDWQTRRDVQVALFPFHGLKANHCRATEYISGFSNPRRKHSVFGWKSPGAFEKRAAYHEKLTSLRPVHVQWQATSE
jgi:putative transposase